MQLLENLTVFHAIATFKVELKKPLSAFSTPY